ncbi:TonB-dependent receptor [Congregibacter brevis]|uniref:TonB-dependent receptor n=1 Tax=Congregibacter brevis TaxID=3081201 RepID=A0ABZ0I8H9_9GAMM|nr:TonB-dependent receptor [Congregibacter sp. IMCC45268]
MNKVSPTRTRSNFSRPSSSRRHLALAVSAALATGAAQAQQLEEVIVTATKRAESVMDVPLAVQALSGDFLRKVNTDDIKDVTNFTPGVSGNSKDSFLDTIAVRGITTNDFGNGGDPSLGVYKNGFYQGRNGAAVTSMFDLERTEILRGPQGFLFGRNSIAGAMNIISQRPTSGEADAYVDLRLGERGIVRVEGGTNFDVSDSISVRIAGLHSREDGYSTNEITGEDFIQHEKSALRFTGSYDAGGNLTATLFVEWEDRDQSGTVYRSTGNGPAFATLEDIYGDIPLPSDPRDVRIDGPRNGLFDGGEVFQIGFELNYDLGWATLTSLTGYKEHDYGYTEDFDATTLTIFNYEQVQEGEYFEQELRLTSDNEGMFNWYAGVSYYQEDIDTEFLGQQAEDVYCNVYWGDTCQGLFDYYNYYGLSDYLVYYFGTSNWTPSANDGLIDDWNRTVGNFSGWAAYVDLQFEFSETLDASFGVRYNDDEKEFSQESLSARNGSLLGQVVQSGFTTPEGAISDTLSWSEPTWRGVVNWRPMEDTLIYFSVTTGYKQGGFNSFSLAGVPFGGVALPGVNLPTSFDSEEVISYEIGYKATQFDGRSQLALNAFTYSYEGLQSTCSEPGSPIVEVCNAELDGIGFEGVWNMALTEVLSFGVGVSYLETEGSNVQSQCTGGLALIGDDTICEGAPAPNIPEWTAYATLDAVVPLGAGELYGNLSVSWEDDAPTDWEPFTPVMVAAGQRMIGSYTEAQALGGYRSDNGWALALYVENLLDDEYYDQGVGITLPGSPYAQFDFGPSRPRTVGMRFTWNL